MVLDTFCRVNQLAYSNECDSGVVEKAYVCYNQ